MQDDSQNPTANQANVNPTNQNETNLNNFSQNTELTPIKVNIPAEPMSQTPSGKKTDKILMLGIVLAAASVVLLLFKLFYP